MSLIDIVHEHRRGHAYEVAMRVREVYGLQIVTTDADLKRILDAVELELVEQDLPGSLTEIVSDAKLLVRPGLPGAQRRWAIAHGLGHFLLRHGGDQIGLDRVWRWRQEREADIFSGFVLVSLLLVEQTRSVFDLAEQANIPIDRAIQWCGWLAVSPWRDVS